MVDKVVAVGFGNDMTSKPAFPGDDNGTIKVWDTRQRSCVFTFDDIHEDFVADFEYNEARKELIAVSGDGTLSVHNLTRGVVRTLFPLSRAHRQAHQQRGGSILFILGFIISLFVILISKASRCIVRSKK